ncbi:glycosyltransferase family A protein [Tautonia sp. JC769]|uniref:glycosyltransferase family 2 protein n=1 Tax=Tautonia sp. JC769 TaxID=3232135 RepID=UPI00345A6819
MSLVSVIIPYYQRKAGVLLGALRGIANQDLPDGWRVEVIIVDDGSPRPARDEVRGAAFPPSVRFRIVEQENRGAAAARNRGLDEASPETTLIAYLDSDDSWPRDHLALGIRAHELGHDFCFSDNRRAGHHTSHIKEGAPKTAAAISRASQGHQFVELPAQSLAGLIVEEFPTQASTVVHRREMAPGLRFDPRLGNCGEDVLYFVALASRARHPCFNPTTVVECGSGFNVFFGRLDWENPSFMDIQLGYVKCYAAILRLSDLEPGARAICRSKLRRKRHDFAFHALRRTVKDRGRIPPQVRSIARDDRTTLLWFPAAMCRVLLLHPLRLYKP